MVGLPSDAVAVGSVRGLLGVYWVQVWSAIVVFPKDSVPSSSSTVTSTEETVIPL